MSSTSAASTEVHTDEDHHDGHHILPLWALLATWGALMILTVLTVTASKFDLGAFDFPVAMGIATVKAMLVLMIFMHLSFDKGFHSLLIFGSFLFVFLFISFLMIDRGQYQPEISTKTNETLLLGN